MKIRPHSIMWSLACVVAACAAPPPLPPATPIANVDSIVGKWQGTTWYHGSSSPGVMTINRDGTWVARTFDRQFRGTYTLTKGEADWTSKTDGATGTWTLHMVKGAPVLDSQGSNGSSAEDRRAG